MIDLISLKRCKSSMALFLLVFLSSSPLFSQTYCDFYAGDSEYDYITNVSLSNLNNSSLTNGSSNPQADYTALTANLNVGQLCTLNVTIQLDDPAFADDNVYAFIDWNGDGDFDDADEFYFLGYVTSGGSTTTSTTFTVPSFAISGSTRMRTVVIWDDVNSNGCASIGQYSFGEAEDYTINISSAPCAAPVNGGTITSQPSFCANTPVSIAASGLSTGIGMAFQWQSSTSGLPGSWVDVAGQTNSSFTAVQTAANNYRIRSVCTNGNDTAYSNAIFVDVSNFNNCYCIGNVYDTDDSYIAEVTLRNVTNTSPVGVCAGYTDYTSLTPIDLLKNIAASFTVNIGNCGSYTYDNGVAIFIDYNQDGDFTDPGEKVYGSTTIGQVFTSSFIPPITANLGVTRMRIVAEEFNEGVYLNSCGIISYGEYEDYLVNILPAPANEVQLVSIVTPIANSCVFGNSLDLSVKNNGSDTLHTLTVNVNTGGLVQNVNWVGSIAPSATQTITVPSSFSYNHGDTLGVRLRNPNGVLDADSSDNYKGFRTYLSLSGNYKVGYGVNNLDSIADINTAIALLNQVGMCGDVYFNIKPGTYTGHYLLTSVHGYQPGMKLVFQSETHNSNDVILEYDATSGANNYIFKLNGADGVQLKNLTLKALNSTFRRSVEFYNGAHDFVLDSCNIIADSLMANFSTSNVNGLVIYSVDTEDNRTIITNNTISGGGVAIYLEGPYDSYESNSVIANNQINSVLYAGLVAYSANNITVQNNHIKISSGSTVSSVFPMEIGYSNDGKVVGNSISGARPGNYLNVVGVKGVIAPFVIANNFVYSSDSSTSSMNAIRISDASASNISVANNSVSVKSKSTGTNGAIYVVDGFAIRLLNNNVGSFGTIPAVRIAKTSSVIESNNNNWFISSSNPVANYVLNPYITLADFQAASGFDAASLSVNPGFTGADLHTCTPELDGAGQTLAYVTNDFDGDARSATSDIGADEFLGVNGNLMVETLIEKCASASVLIGVPAQSGVTYSWSNGNTNSEFATSTDDIYVLTATSNCGSILDTIEVVNKPSVQAAASIGFAYGLSIQFNNASTNALSYSWNFGDGQTSTDAAPTHIYSAGGNYVVTFTAYGECDTASQTIVVDAVAVSVEEFASENLKLFPNPATDFVTIQLNEISTQDASLKVIDITGKAVYVQALDAVSDNITFDVNRLAPGVYNVLISNANAVYTAKFVKK